jgi:endonuclease/exonuclease/phosphatase family metal-dependent hydrolase
VRLRILSWNLFHGRDFPPDPALRTCRSRILGLDERNDTHLQVNRDLLAEFSSMLAGADWDVALLQECPPRWTADLAEATGSEAHIVLTSRNSLGGLRALLARHNPDLIASSEGGSNLTMVRPTAGGIAERRELELTTRPERRALAFTRLDSGICIANVHASTADALATEELVRGAERAVEWSAGAPLVFGGDFNVRPERSGAFDELTARFGLSAPTEPAAIDHVLARGLDVIRPSLRWPPEAREATEDGLAIRLSDHAPVEAEFAAGEAVR